MKGNTKKLTLLIIITVISTFMLAATVTANPSIQRPKGGEYAVSGMATGMTALCGFDPSFTPNFVESAPLYFLYTIQVNGKCTFQRDGTGNCSETLGFILMPNQLLPINPWAGEMSASYSFTYSFDPDGSIVMTCVPGSFLGTWVSGPNVGATTTDGPPPRRGKVTPDAKVITLTTYPLIPINQSVDYGCGPDFPAQRFEVQSVTLIWQNDKKY